MYTPVFGTVLIVTTSAIFLSTTHAEVLGKTGTDSAKTAVPSPSTVNTLRPQTTCPVMGTEINRKLYVDYKGKRIYVCCTDCIEQVAKDPERYIRKLESMGQSVETIGNETKKAGVEATTGMSTKKMSMVDNGVVADAMVLATDTDYWACPMHPAIRKTGSGNCPLCGKKLVFRKGDKDTSGMIRADRTDVKK